MRLFASSFIMELPGQQALPQFLLTFKNKARIYFWNYHNLLATASIHSNFVVFTSIFQHFHVYLEHCSISWPFTVSVYYQPSIAEPLADLYVLGSKKTKN